MFSTIDRSIVYEVGTDITENDINIVSDLWTMEDRQVYRGARDPNYTHANVYWLYDPDSLDRVGLSEHKLDDPSDVALLWYKENPFSTLLQEDGWVEGESFWSKVPSHVYEQCLAEGWTTPAAVAERCLRGATRVVTVDTLIAKPTVYSCAKCKTKSFTKSACSTESTLDFPEKEKVWFIDERMVVYTPPTGSSVWSITQPQSPSDPSSQPEVQTVPVQPVASEGESPHSSPPETHPQ